MDYGHFIIIRGFDAEAHWTFTLLTNHAVSYRADLRERTKTMSRHGDRWGQFADFRGSFETIDWLYILFKYGIKTKTHFEWLLWHRSSLGQLNLEPNRPNGLVGCKVPTDLVKISVKEATHMGFYYISKSDPLKLWPVTGEPAAWWLRVSGGKVTFWCQIRPIFKHHGDVGPPAHQECQALCNSLYLSIAIHLLVNSCISLHVYLKLVGLL